MNLLGYVRVSRVGGREGDSFISPDVQREKIEQWCRLHNHELLDVHVDLDESGGKVDRPEFQRALGRIDSGEAQGIVVAKLDRFARSIAGAADTIRRLDAAGAVLVSVAENIDSGPGGKLMRSILFAFAEFERDRIGESWATARAHAIERGAYIAGTAPTGYTVGSDGRLVIDPAAGPAVRAAFEARALGASWTAIAQQLDAAGVRPDGRRWTPGALGHVVKNRAYLGEARSGAYVNPDAHEPLVSRALFEAANDARSLAPARTGSAAGGGLLSGLIRCAGCRYSMSYTGPLAGNRSPRYLCKRRHAGGMCQACAALVASSVEQYVAAAFLDHHANVTLVSVTDASDIALLEAAVRDAEAELHAYVGVMRATDDGYRAGYDLRAEGLSAARASLVEASRAAPAPLAPAELREHWTGATVAERRALLAADITAVMVRKGAGPITDRVRIVWAGESVELPRRGAVANELRSYEWAAA